MNCSMRECEEPAGEGFVTIIEYFYGKETKLFLCDEHYKDLPEQNPQVRVGQALDNNEKG